MTDGTSDIRDLSNAEARRQLRHRARPYWEPILSGRHVGFYRSVSGGTCWVARFRYKDGRYRQRRLGGTDELCGADGKRFLSYEQAVEHAKIHFSGAAGIIADPDPVRAKALQLLYSPVGSVFTLGHALSDYLEWKRLTASESHFYVLVTIVNRYLLPRIGPLAVSELHTDHFRACFQYAMETSRTRGKRATEIRQSIKSLDADTLRKRKRTVNILIMILKESLKLAWENGRSDNDRIWRALRPIRNVARPRMLHLSRKECRALVKCCAPAFKAFVKGALYTGCRSVELRRMRVEDVGRDGFGVYVQPTKTKVPRFVFLPDSGMAFFLKLAKNKQPHEFLFARPDGKCWSKDYLSQIREAVRRAKLPKEFTFHGLRHTYASQLVQAGTPLTVVAEQLGHASTNTVSRTYAHVAPQIREAEVRQRFVEFNVGREKISDADRQILIRWKKARGHEHCSYARIADLKSVGNIL